MLWEVPEFPILVTFHMEYITPYVDTQLILQDPFQQLKKKNLLEFSCFAMLCWFMFYSKVNQQYIHIYPLFSGFSSHLGHHGALRRVPCAIQSRSTSDTYSFWSILPTSRFKTTSTHSLSLIDMTGPFISVWLIVWRELYICFLPQPACSS